MSEKKTLFADFDSANFETWEKQAIKDLGASDFSTIIWENSFGKILPYYTELPSGNEKSQGIAANYDWCNMPQISLQENEEKLANSSALAALNAGADGILFDLSEIEKIDFTILLQNIGLNYCQIGFNSKKEAHLEQFKVYLKQHYAELLADVHGFFCLEAADNLHANQWETIPNFAQIVLFSKEKDEIDCISQLVRQFANLVKNAPEIAQNAVFSLVVFDDFFVEMAKIRALKKLLLGMANQLNWQNWQPKIHAQTSIKINAQTQADPYLNMLSNTTQAMSAVIAGVDWLTVKRHNEGIQETSDLAERVARNVSAVLKEESFLAKVADASAGAYYVEQLTEKMAKKAWENAFLD